MSELPPCVLPRRRFVLVCLGLCLLFVLAILAWFQTFSTEFFVVCMLEIIMLSWPSRTVHGTLMQLAGLVMPLSAAVIIMLTGIEEYTGVYFPYVVFWPFALIFWGGIVLYPLVCSGIYLWYSIKMQK